MDNLYIQGSSKFQELNFKSNKSFHPKLQVIRLKGIQQVMQLIRQQELKDTIITRENAALCQQCTDRNSLPQVPIVSQMICYPPRIEIRKPERKLTQTVIKRSFIESNENSIERKKDPLPKKLIEPKNTFLIKRPIASGDPNSLRFKGVNTTSTSDESRIEERDITVSVRKIMDISPNISYTNYLLVTAPDKCVYKAMVTKGNNGSIIRQCLKTRSWWTLVENMEEVNLYWTQLRKQPFYGELKQYSLSSQVFSKSLKKTLENQLQFPLKEQMYQIFDGSENLKVHNHLECNFQVCNKKALFYNMKQFYTNKGQDPFQMIPRTFHVIEGLQDKQYKEFEDYARAYKIDRWIVKPGEQSNRGNGIELASNMKEVRAMVSTKQTHANGQPKTFIIQQYIQNPLLYCKRKFDIRCYMLVTSINKQIKMYWYQEGYIRTSCKEFNLEDMDCKFMHLTNDAVQKKSNQYGKFENANKVSYNEFQKYLNEQYQCDFKQIQEQLKNLSKDIISATYQHLDPNQQFYSFELFGLDFMIDDKMHPWLIEVNTNPCLEMCCPLLSRLISHLIENTIRIAIDPLFPPPLHKKKTKLQDFKNLYELVYASPLESQSVLPKISQDDDEEEVEDDN